jgi:hypothetical protein
MTSSSFWPVSRRKTAERGGFLAPALWGSIALAIFVVVTQLLATTGAISLSATQLLAIWLVAAALIVLLWITYMICRAYVTQGTPAEPRVRPVPEANGAPEAIDPARWDAGRAYDDPKAEKPVQVVAAEEPEQGLRDGSPRNNGGGPPSNGSAPNDKSAGEDEDAWVPPGELRYLAGSERYVSTAEVFPKGCYLQPDSITQDVKDKLSGQLVYQCRVVDRNPAEVRTHEAVVKILADRRPAPPTGQRFERVEFENLSITPYITDRSPMRIWYSLRATGIHAPSAPSDRMDAEWTAFSNGQTPEDPALSR